MIGYVTLGTNDLDKACGFYDELLSLIGAKRMMEDENFVAWAVTPEAPSVAVTKPFNGEASTVGNGVMVALMVDSVELVTSMYNRAIALGGIDEGAPGPRGDSGFYAGYFRDLDGNKLNVFCMANS